MALERPVRRFQVSRDPWGIEQRAGVAISRIEDRLEGWRATSSQQVTESLAMAAG